MNAKKNRSNQEYLRESIYIPLLEPVAEDLKNRFLQTTIKNKYRAASLLWWDMKMKQRKKSWINCKNWSEFSIHSSELRRQNIEYSFVNIILRQRNGSEKYVKNQSQRMRFIVLRVDEDKFPMIKMWQVRDDLINIKNVENMDSAYNLA